MDVLDSGSFIISKATFPEYFDKDNLQPQQIDCSKDVVAFCNNIVPALKLKRRFVGNEPFCNVTNQYNSAFKEMITSYGVELIEIQRKKYNGSEISASNVRKLIKKKNFNLIKAIVAETTYEYIINRFS